MGYYSRLTDRSLARNPQRPSEAIAAARPAKTPAQLLRRVRIWYMLVVIVMGVFFVRLFYMQVIQHDFYKKSALTGQLREYEIPAARGVIKAYEGETIVPIVLNEKLFTVYADPTLVKPKHLDRDATMLAAVLKDKPAADYKEMLQAKDTRYVILGKRVTEAQRKELLQHKFAGIGAQEQQYRTYPNGTLAAQLLGFVNNEGKGVYGIEQALDEKLAGKAGQLKAVTDINGVPLAANRDNVLLAPKTGEGVVLTVDTGMQRQAEALLEKGLQDAKSKSGSVIIMDMTGGIKAMANYPTYNPADYTKIENGAVFNNNAVSSPVEIGSIMKPLTMAAALDKGSVAKDTSYYDPAQWTIDGYKITNIEEDGGAGTKNMSELLNLSLNTGATWLLMRMGGSGTTVNQQGREAWYSYMTDHFRFGRETGIEQGYEAPGDIPDPNKGYGRDLTYANTSFGQGMTATMIQVAGAYTAMLNGGTYYQPHLVDQTIAADGKATKKSPVVVSKNVVKPSVSQDLQEMLEYVIDNHFVRPAFDQKTYSVGGKTGTAQIAKPEGGYFEDDYTGTYAGFVGGDQPQYVIVVQVDKPKIKGYAGGAAAQPIFVNIARTLLTTFSVTPRE
jgi:cell division protein FtsI (penicillin-binding protein 3)